MDKIWMDRIINNALEEDINYYDITTDTLIPENSISKAVITGKQDGVLAGMDLAKRVFWTLNSDIRYTPKYNDGDTFKVGTVLAELEGSTRDILKGERTALNILQRMSGIATKTKEYCDLVRGFNVRLTDTRKTSPGLRVMEKYAVRMGGGYNHRFNLSDGVLIKDNHIKAAGGISKAISTCKDRVGHTVKIEIEIETIEQLKEALIAEADIIMLDNMDIETIEKAVNIIEGKAVVEVSGNISLKNVRRVAETGVDIISVGALTHTLIPIDMSMKLF